MIPIHKDKCLKKYQNYIPISTLPAISKCIEFVIKDSPLKYLEHNDIITKNNAGLDDDQTFHVQKHIGNIY